jgi:acylphosphatase
MTGLFLAEKTMKRIHVIVTGLVQGVGFRAGTQRHAIAQNLTGWVRNLPDGSVEFEAEGAKEDVDALVMWAWKGTWAAQVSNVKVTEIDPCMDTGFRIL